MSLITYKSDAVLACTGSKDQYYIPTSYNPIQLIHVTIDGSRNPNVYRHVTLSSPSTGRCVGILLDTFFYVLVDYQGSFQLVTVDPSNGDAIFQRVSSLNGG